MANVPRNSWGDPIKPTAASSAGEAVWGDAEAVEGAGQGSKPELPKGKFTEKELEVLRTMKQSADVWRNFGFLAGTTGAIVLIRRTQKPPGLLSRVFVTLFAGAGFSIVGAMANVSINAPKALRNVEDPRHMAQTMGEIRNARMQGMPPPPDMRREEGATEQFRQAWKLGPPGPRAGQDPGGPGGAPPGGVRDLGTGSAERPWGESQASSPPSSQSSPSSQSPSSYPSRLPPRPESTSTESRSQTTQSDPFAIPPAQNTNNDSARASRWAQLRAGNGGAKASAPEADTGSPSASTSASTSTSAGASGSAWERLRRGEGPANMAGGPESGIKESW